MNNMRNLAWKLNWFRHSELEGALLLGRIVRAADDPRLIASLTRHCADEARHAWMWARTIAELRLPMVQIFRSYQSLYWREGAMPSRVVEVLALTHVFEQRVDKQFRIELETTDLPPAAARTYRALIEDEQDHLDWVGRWLERQPDGPALIERYRIIDARVYSEIRESLSAVWEIPGLGRELASVQTEEMHQVVT